MHVAIYIFRLLSLQIIDIQSFKLKQRASLNQVTTECTVFDFQHRKTLAVSCKIHNASETLT